MEDTFVERERESNIYTGEKEKTVERKGFDGYTWVSPARNNFQASKRKK